jgi:hypothetical protein
MLPDAASRRILTPLEALTQLQPADAIFCAGNIISTFDPPYCHVGMLEPGWAANAWRVVEVKEPQGGQRVWLADWLAIHGTADVYRCRNIDANTALYTMMLRVGTPYGWLDCMWAAVKVLWRCGKRLLGCRPECASAVCRAYRDASPLSSRRDLPSGNGTSPTELASCEALVYVCTIQAAAPGGAV